MWLLEKTFITSFPKYGIAEILFISSSYAHIIFRKFLLPLFANRVVCPYWIVPHSLFC
jgi:hypothetical protein